MALRQRSSVEEQVAAVGLVEGREATDAVEKTNVLRFTSNILFFSFFY